MRLCATATLALLTACGGATSGECPVGDPGCPCAAGTCPVPLVCRDDVCVFGGAEDGSGSDSQDDASSSGSAGSSDPTDDETGDDGTSDPGGPEVFELFADQPSLREGNALLLTAQVTDPDGLEDIVGGVLVDNSSGATYGSFVQISEGSFEMLVTWDGIDEVAPIHFEWEGSASFRAEFVDQAQNMGTRTIDIPFDCGGPDFGVCGDATCRSLGTSDDCEGCNDACLWCENAVCTRREWSPCFEPWANSDCAEVCASQGYAGCLDDCLDENYSVVGTIAYYESLAACDVQMASQSTSGESVCGLTIEPWPAARCCCGPL